MRSLSGAQSQRGFGVFGLEALARAVQRRTSRKAPIARRQPGEQQKLPRKALRAEKPGWRERWRKGEAPNRLALGATLFLYGATCLYGAALGGLFPTVRGGLHQAFAAATKMVGFGLSEIRITGAQRLTPTDILQRIGVSSDTSLLAFDAEAARKALLDISWVKSASIRVYLPGTIEITLVEREPFALWQRAGKVVLIDRDGLVIGPYDDARFSALPLVVGEGAERRVGEIGTLLDPHPAIRSRVRAAVLVADRRWTLKLGDGVDIMLPERDPATAVAVLEKLDHDTGLLNRDIAAVDMRLNDRVVVRLTDRGAQIRAEALKVRSRMPGSATPPTGTLHLAPPRPPGRST